MSTYQIIIDIQTDDGVQYAIIAQDENRDVLVGEMNELLGRSRDCEWFVFTPFDDQTGEEMDEYDAVRMEAVTGMHLVPASEPVAMADNTDDDSLVHPRFAKHPEEKQEADRDFPYPRGFVD